MPRPWPYITQQDATAQVRESPYITLDPGVSPQNHSHTQFCPLTHEQRLRLRPPTTQTVGSSAAVVFPHAPRLGFSSFGTRLHQPHTRRTNAHTVGPSRQWFHGPNVLHPPAESPRPAPTRVTPEHYITSLGQHGIALDTHVVRASLLRLSHNKRVLTRPCVALTASTAAGMTYGPTTILMSAPLPANAAEVRHSLGLLQQWHFGLRALLPP